MIPGNGSSFVEIFFGDRQILFLYLKKIANFVAKFCDGSVRHFSCPTSQH